MARAHEEGRTSPRFYSAPLRLALRRRAFEVEGEQALQRLLGRNVLRPTVGARYGALSDIYRPHAGCLRRTGEDCMMDVLVCA